MNYEEVKSAALKLEWKSRLRLAQELLETLHQQIPSKPKVVDQAVPPSELQAEDFGVLGLDETVTVVSVAAQPVTIASTEAALPADESSGGQAGPIIRLNDSSSIAESFQKLREALESEMGESSS